MGKQFFKFAHTISLAPNDIATLQVGAAMIEIELDAAAQGRINIRATTPLYKCGIQKALIRDGQPLPGQRNFPQTRPPYRLLDDDDDEPG